MAEEKKKEDWVRRQRVKGELGKASSNSSIEWLHSTNIHTVKIDGSLKEAVKYYFADFIRKRGTGSPPFTDKKFSKEGLPD